MSRKHHHLKTESKFYQDIESGKKKFEVRKDDRDFQIHDMIYLEETLNGEYTGRKFRPLEIKYILHGGQFGIEQGFCVLNW